MRNGEVEGKASELKVGSNANSQQKAREEKPNSSKQTSPDVSRVDLVNRIPTQPLGQDLFASNSEPENDDQIKKFNHAEGQEQKFVVQMTSRNLKSKKVKEVASLEKLSQVEE